MNGPDSIFHCVGLATPPQQACYLSSIASTHFYTWVEMSSSGNVPYSRTQRVDRNGARTHNLLFMNPALIRKTTCAHKFTKSVEKTNKFKLPLYSVGSFYEIYFVNESECKLWVFGFLVTAHLEDNANDKCSHNLQIFSGVV